MTRRSWWILAALAVFFFLAGLAAAMTYLFGDRDREWTTRSKAALEAFEKGLEARTRGYQDAAIGHFDRALELDPKFTMAKLYLSRMYAPSNPRSKKLIEELEHTDLEGLRPRERFLLRYGLADAAGRNDEAAEILNEFLKRHPGDFYGLDTQCSRAWWERRWDSAEECYFKLIQKHPNHVEAYNRLGFIDMAQGRFSEAEEQFRTYCFIAPDQALPFTSLAELLILLGRYEEADESIAKALAIEDGFCMAHQQRIRAYYFSGRTAEARREIDRMEALPECAYLEPVGFYCSMRGIVDYFDGDFEKAWSEFSGECLERRHGFDLIGHHVAVATGRIDEARRMVKNLRAFIDKNRAQDVPVDPDWFVSLCAHLEGVQLMAAGEYAEASVRLREADERLQYWMPEQSGFKLLNRAFLARSLELEGATSESQALTRMVDAVNPRFIEHLPRPSFLEPPQH